LGDGGNLMNQPQLVEVYRARNMPQAVALKQVLEEAGIRAAVENALLQGVVGELPMGWATAPRILVESGDAPRARDILERSERAEMTAPEGEGEADDGTSCLACGTPLADEAERCPACGWSYKSSESENEDA
jgi:rubrerythrin